MKALGIVASPRTDGNTAFAVEKALEGTGAETRILNMNGIAPCRSCFACKNTQKCTLKDGMQEVYAALEESDALVLGSPIYLDHVSAQAWVFINRLYCYLGPGVESRWKGPRCCLLVATQGVAERDHYRPQLDQVAAIFKSYWNVEGIDHLVVGGCPRFGGIADRADAVEAALAAGGKLAAKS